MAAPSWSGPASVGSSGEAEPSPGSFGKFPETSPDVSKALITGFGTGGVHVG